MASFQNPRSPSGHAQSHPRSRIIREERDEPFQQAYGFFEFTPFAQNHPKVEECSSVIRIAFQRDAQQGNPFVCLALPDISAPLVRKTGCNGLLLPTNDHPVSGDHNLCRAPVARKLGSQMLTDSFAELVTL